MASKRRPKDHSAERPSRGLEPEAALQRWSDPTAFAEMMEYVQFARQTPATPEGIAGHREYQRRRNDLETAFVEKLQARRLWGSAIPNGADDREIIRPNLWDRLEINYELDDIHGLGRHYEAAEFFEASAVPLNVQFIPERFSAPVGLSAGPATKEPQRSSSESDEEPTRCILFAVEGSQVLFSGGITVTSARAALILKLLPKFDEDVEAERAPSEFRFTKVEALARTLTSNDLAVRRLIARTRADLTKDFRERFGIILHRGSIVENNRWQGYRLNPKLIRVKSFQLGDPV
jgi:hypothetical protein